MARESIRPGRADTRQRERTVSLSSVVDCGKRTDCGVPLQDKGVWETLLSSWYVKEPDSGTHSAAGWVLRQWKSKLPKIKPSKQPEEGMEWHVTNLGMTMLKMPAGSFVRKDARDIIGQRVTLTRSFLLADREVSRQLFQQFVDDPDYPDDEKPKKWPGVSTADSPTVKHPVQRVSWCDAVPFCNWVSHKEGLTPCYERTGEKEQYTDYANRKVEYDAWRIVPDANGYRLPTEAEWEYACRACSATAYGFGDDKKLLDRYAVYRVDRAEIPGSKLPNGWGLFDMHGNVREWCWDRYGDSGSGLWLADPMGPLEGKFRVLRGGSFLLSTSDVRSAECFPNLPGDRFVLAVGFRAARTYP